MKTTTTETQEQVDWPGINRLLWLRLSCCPRSVHPSRVEGLRDGNLVIARPAQPHLNPVSEPGDGVDFTVGWAVGNASAEVQCRFVEAYEDSVPVWEIRVVSPLEMIQRRRFLRVMWPRPLELFLPNIEGVVEGRIVDISEGGLRCEIDSEIVRPFVERFQIGFELELSPLVVHSEIAWWGEDHNGRRQVGLQFTTVDPPLADRLRSHTFALQVQGRRRLHV